MPDLHSRFVDERLAKALSHPLRPRILEQLTERGSASPSELADALGQPLGNVSYHVRILRELECVELVRTEPRRGALEHFYRATAHPWLDDEQWAGLPTGFRAKTLGHALSVIFDEAHRAIWEGGFDDPETHVSRVELVLDAESRSEITDLLARTRGAAQRISRESAERQAGRGPEAPPPSVTALALLHFPHKDTT